MAWKHNEWQLKTNVDARWHWYTVDISDKLAEDLGRMPTYCQERGGREKDLSFLSCSLPRVVSFGPGFQLTHSILKLR